MPRPSMTIEDRSCVIASVIGGFEWAKVARLLNFGYAC